MEPMIEYNPYTYKYLFSISEDRKRVQFKNVDYERLLNFLCYRLRKEPIHFELEKSGHIYLDYPISEFDYPLSDVDIFLIENYYTHFNIHSDH
jgi:hypothetical protein